MDEQTHKPNIREAIDACRPDSDDLALPEMSELARRIDRDASIRQSFQRSQRLDAAIGKAIHDAPVPTGLHARLIASLSNVQPPSRDTKLDAITRAVTSAEIETDASGAVDIATQPRDRWSRRRWIGISGAVAASLAITVCAAVIIAQPSAPISADTLANDVPQWLDEAFQNEWNSNVQSAPSEKYPLHPTILPKPQQWQRIATQYDRSTVIYDITPPGKQYVFQITVRTNRTFNNVPGNLPLRPQSSTGGLSIGICHRDGVLYILVVEGDARRYRSFVEERLPFA